VGEPLRISAELVDAIEGQPGRSVQRA
jgi:hypothetical protein